jgi:hypothetical protein
VRESKVLWTLLFAFSGAPRSGKRKRIRRDQPVFDYQVDDHEDDRGDDRVD